MPSHVIPVSPGSSITELAMAPLHHNGPLGEGIALGLMMLIGLAGVLQLCAAHHTALHSTAATKARLSAMSEMSSKHLHHPTHRHTIAKVGRGEGGQRPPSNMYSTSQLPNIILHSTKQATAKEGLLASIFMGISAFLGSLAVATFLKTPGKPNTSAQHADAMITAAPVTHKYKLRYFDARGVAEVVRFMFAIAGVPYEDYRYKFFFGVPGNFSTISMPEFHNDKSSGVLDLSMERLPILEVDGVPIGQSKAIERYLARKFGFFGDNEIEAAHIDMICEHVRDIKDGYRKLLNTKDSPEKQAALQKWYSQDLPAWCRRLEKCLGPDRWAVGSKFSLADINIWALLADTFSVKEAAIAAYKDCPHLQAICANVAALEGVQTWMQNRPSTLI